MRQTKKLIVVFMIFFIFSSLSSFGLPQAEDDVPIQNSWSSVDNVFLKKDIDILVKKPMAGPIKIGITSKEVQEVMGVPDRIDEEEHVFYYRTSPIYFNQEWKVQSWDNRYGNLDVLEEIVAIELGSHVSEVFKEKGFPLRVKKVNHSYQLEYPDEMIYLGERWRVEAIQPRHEVTICEEREAMILDDFIKEFKSCFPENPLLIEK